ncbi:hypothetical protein [Patiriisocius hiemis]|uniref:Adenylosuccinate synthetase n=1 Tax=Patiriisocius hiemis TaxID=3075604 RepID=A0ABU2Y9K0_9FLAO|nr:hypothetical protein [Constantimarinum sp. W242]MDT0554855.1 hypothetical protein [Constantimarinum sp. W242]
MKYSKIIFIVFIFFGINSVAQIPSEVPHPDTNRPIDMDNTTDIIIYIVLPILILLLYFFVKRFKRSKK